MSAFRVRRFGLTAAVAAAAVLAGCDARVGVTDPGAPAPPRALEAWYYAHAVHLSWELSPRWSGETFRIYGRRTTDASDFLIAEVTSCRGGVCSYRDTNIVPGVAYRYFVTAMDPDTGKETSSATSVQVAVPHPDPPPVPAGLDGVPLDGAVFLRWNDRSRDASDFAFYRVYLEGGDGSVLLLGETDSEGFLDLLVENGNTYGYFVTAVDELGHESQGSALAEATPRPDYSGELLYAYQDRPALAGFRFQESEALDPIRHGGSVERHFRLEVDAEGWWLVPGPDVQVHQDWFFTTQLRCGPAADAGCIDIRTAPVGGYGVSAVPLHPEFAYVLRVPAQGGWRYGVIRVSHVGFAQDGAIAIFDWAFQLQVDNRALMPVAP